MVVWLFSRIGLVIAGKWIAGTSIGDAIKEAKRLNSLKESVIMNYLGEELKDANAIRKNVDTYISLLKEMKRERVEGSISVKPTQLGLTMGKGKFVRNYAAVAQLASKLGIFVWLDMENYEYIQDTIDGYLLIHKKYKNTGVCIQARVKRSFDDIKLILRNKGIVRLVKGAYNEDPTLSYALGEETDRDYKKCLGYLFRNSGRFMVATHDSSIVEKVLRLKRRGKGKIVEFAMLKGVRAKLAKELVSRGERVSVYVPFGEDWLAYSIRRIKEEGHLLLLLRSIFQG